MWLSHLKSSWWVSGYCPYLVVLLFVSWFNNTAADSALLIKQDGSPEKKILWFSSFTSGGNLLIAPSSKREYKLQVTSSKQHLFIPPIWDWFKKRLYSLKNTHTNVTKYGSIRHLGRKRQEILYFPCLFQEYIKQITSEIMDQGLYVSTLGR